MMRKMKDNAVPNTGRRNFIAGSAALAAASWMPQAWASRGQTEIIVPFTASGPTDLIARVIAEELRAKWDSPVVVLNKPGAGASIGAQYVANAAADGRTLLLTAAAHVMNATFIKPAYHPVEDFVSIAPIAYQPVILCVSADDPIQDFADFRKELARLKDSLTMGFAGVGNSSHLAWLTLEPHLEGTAVPVPYKGSSELNTALIGQQVRAAFVNTTVAGPLITGGRVRGLAVTSKSRWRQFPDMPTVAELGFPGYENTTWYTFLGPKGIPEQEADMLERDIKWTLEKQHVRDVIYNGGLDLLDTPRKVFHQEMTEEYEKWARVLAEMSKAK